MRKRARWINHEVLSNALRGGYTRRIMNAANADLAPPVLEEAIATEPPSPSDEDGMLEESMLEAAEALGDERAAPEKSGVGDIIAPPAREKIEAQLRELQRKEAELRRALAVADHPDLGDAIREVEGRAFGVTRAELKLADPLSKSESKRRDTLEAKLAKAKTKRDDIELEIMRLEEELSPLGEARLATLREAREEALLKLLAAMNRHADAFAAADLDEVALVPDLARWLPELRALADSHLQQSR